MSDDDQKPPKPEDFQKMMQEVFSKMPAGSFAMPGMGSAAPEEAPPAEEIIPKADHVFDFSYLPGTGV